MQMYVTGVRTRKNQQAFNEPRETVYFFQHASNHIPVFRRTLVLLKGDLTDTPDGGQGSAQFMRCVGSEAPQLFKSSLQPPKHVVQYHAKSSQLIFPILDWEPSSQILGRYFLCFARHLINRCQGLASQGVPSETGKQ